MKATELRIGNYVLDSKDGYVYQISSPKSLDEAFLYYPIKLTEKELIKLGFEENKYRIYKKNDFEVWTTNKGLAYGYNPVVFLHSVHQLQNLHYAITGEEL